MFPSHDRGVRVEEDIDTSFDDRFYWAKGIEKKLEDENVVDVNGKAVIDPTTGKQMIQRGLKYLWIEQTKSSANGLLTVSDWYVTRKSETDTAKNVTGNWLYADGNFVEDTGSSRYLDFVSNGVKLRNGGTGTNSNGVIYLYMAFAEQPFKFANAR